MTIDTIDLRALFPAYFSQAMWAGADDDADDLDDDGDADELDDEDPSSLPADDADENDDEPPKPKKKPRQDARIVRANNQAARYRVRARQEKERAESAEADVAGLQDQVRDLRLRLAFNDAAHNASITDRDAAWTLVTDDLAAIDVDEDGTVDTDRLGDIIAHVAKRYPYLVNDDEAPTSPPSDLPSVKAAGRGRRKNKLDAKALAKQYPALAGRHR